MTDLSLLTIATMIGCLLLGLSVGAAYFAAMWRSAELFAAGGRMILGLALSVGRFAMILGVLGGVAIQFGALPLLMTALGIVIARFMAVRRVKAMAP